MDCTFLTYFDFRGSRIGRKLSVPWEGMIETNLSIQRDSRVGRRLSVSLSVATLSPLSVPDSFIISVAMGRKTVSCYLPPSCVL